MKYATEQRAILLSFLKANSHRQYPVDIIAKELCKKYNISISSIYRNVNKMVEQGYLARFSQNGSRKFLYQYIGGHVCSDHLHLKCQQCGKLFHLDDRTMDSILTAAMRTNNFNIDREKTILYGECAGCRI